MYTKPYVEYGVGVQKYWSDKVIAFGQVMLRGGGRNGVALSAGFRWAIGKEGKPIQKVSLPQSKEVKTSHNSERNVIKTLADVKKSTRTNNIAIIKHL
jgi:hypothetical protein